MDTKRYNCYSYIGFFVDCSHGVLITNHANPTWGLLIQHKSGQRLVILYYQRHQIQHIKLYNFNINYLHRLQELHDRFMKNHWSKSHYLHNDRLGAVCYVIIFKNWKRLPSYLCCLSIYLVKYNYIICKSYHK